MACDLQGVSEDRRRGQWVSAKLVSRGRSGGGQEWMAYLRWILQRTFREAGPVCPGLSQGHVVGRVLGSWIPVLPLSLHVTPCFAPLGSLFFSELSPGL